ncbi:hypothetical protein DOY81_003464 [Sarcophaga bullata]|nr:hypothetical protein DOY81_003464 [Sarcophaga bullata]
MIELLSLPRRPHHNVRLPSNIKFQSGLPINSLPGWEHIPLNGKLPMLKCPGNQVIFSKNKIGQSLRCLKQEFDSSGYDRIPEYNPLHDCNLKTFYANERNLKRLRENGEITANNDVICNLKDFNEYRQQLHKSQLYYILQEMNKMEGDQRDRLLISNAEQITKQDHQNLSAREHTYLKVLQRKAELDQQKAERFRKLYEKTQDKFAYVEVIQSRNRSAIQYKKTLRQLRAQKYAEVRGDLQRKQLIYLKKLFRFKKDRLNKNLKNLFEGHTRREEEKQINSWNKRLEERIANVAKVKLLLKQNDQRKKIFIENHKRKYHSYWDRIKQNIRKIALKNRMQRSLKDNTKTITTTEKENDLSVHRTHSGILCRDFQDSFDKLMDSDICAALDAALDMEDQTNVPFDTNDPIYKAAKFIMKHILTKFHKDLSTDKIAYQNVYERLDNFFTEAKNFVIFRSTQIISALKDPDKRPNARSGSIGRVSFSNMPSTIGIGSYQINPFIELREVTDRRPTPPGSLTSIVLDSTTSLAKKTNCTNLCRNELIFIEHYLAKFKRELIVGIGRKVFGAIQCHFEHKIMDVRQELLDIDRKFLLNQVTKSILSHAVNPLNLESNIKLCVSALSSDIIWSLQKQLLKMPHDPRRMGKPCIKCSCNRKSAKICLFCD